MKTLVLGLGNELYGDDGIGIHVIRGLKSDLEIRKEFSSRLKSVHLEECSLSGLSILEVIVGYDRIILIDTIKKSHPQPGKIHILEGSELRAIPGPSPHYVSIPQMLEIGKKMGLKVPSQVKIIAVEAKNMYHLGEGLSEDMNLAIPKILAELKKLI